MGGRSNASAFLSAAAEEARKTMQGTNAWDARKENRIGVRLNVRKADGMRPVLSLIKGDKRTTVLHILIPRYEGGVDLGGLKWIIAYINADGGEDICKPTEEPVVGSSHIEIQWLIGGLSTAAEGITRFEVDGFSEDADKVWQSGKYGLEILPGLDAGESGGESEPSAVMRFVLLAEQLADVLEGGEDGQVLGRRDGKAAWVDPENAGSGSGEPGRPGIDGEDGGYYQPEVINGVLRFTPSKESMPEVPEADIRGPKGEPGKDAVPYTLPAATPDTLGGVKVGKGLRMDGDMLGVVPEGEYELIETITLEEAVTLERSAEPDGTPYAFKAMTVKTMTTGTQDKACRLYYLCDGAILASTYYDAISSEGTRYKLDIVEPHHGYWKSSNSSWRTNNSTYASLECGGATMTMVHDTKGYPSISRIRTNGPLPAGTTMEIWGVRA